MKFLFFYGGKGFIVYGRGMGCGGLFAGLRGNPGNRENENCKVHVAGYAGDEAGTPSLNMRYSKERAEKVVAAFVAAGVGRTLIVPEWKGDTVQPFADNEKNRAAIVAVTGEGVKKEPVTTKKFRTEESVIV